MLAFGVVAGASAIAAPPAPAASCPVSSPYSALIAGTSALVGYWRLGEASGKTACDVTGSNDGTYAAGPSGSTLLGRPGALSGDADTATRFTGTGQAVVPHAAGLNLNGAFTVELWMKPETLPTSGFPGVLRKGHSEETGVGGGWLLYYQHDTRALGFKRDAYDRTAPGWQLGPPGTWSHVAVAYDGTAQNTLRLYLNGNLVGTGTGPPGGYSALSSTDPLQLGHGDTDDSDHTVDDVALYSSALTSADLLQHYQAGVGGGTGQPPSSPTSLTAAGGDAHVRLTWSAPTSPDIASYRVYRRNPDGSWPSYALAGLPGSTLSYTDSSLSEGTTYDYRVTAVSSSGAESAPSTEAAAAPTGALPPGFFANTLAAGLTRPTAVAWAPDGRMFVAEKDGIVRVVDAGGNLLPSPLIDISDHVNSFSDRGLLGIAVDPQFASNHHLYLLYTYELEPLSPDGTDPMVSRLTRVTVNPDNTVDPGVGDPETVILGTDTAGPCLNPQPAGSSDDCIPSDGHSHSIGTVRADPDGTLWIGSGDSSSYSTVDPLAFRVYNENSFAGKVIHVDGDGRGLPGHPFCPADTNLQDVCTKIYAKGFRNPFRFALRAGSTPVVGDVGWTTRDEIDRLRRGGNYGWPCYEGSIHTPGYSDDPRCADEYAKEGTANADVPPDYDYGHDGSGSAIVGGPVYSGTTYPGDYSGSAFFADYAKRFVRRLEFDGQGNVSGVQDFAPHQGAVDLEQAPDGNVAYVDIGNFSPGTGSVAEWPYTPGNGPPVALAQATPTSGDPPLAVQFTGSSSSDPDNDALAYDWDFGDGSSHSSAADPAHTYSNNGTYAARLRVDDHHGHTASNAVTIQVGKNTPPAATIAAPADGSTYRDGQYILLHGSASDPEDAALPDSALSWHVVLHHNTHTHDLGTFAGPHPVFRTFVDHDADSYYEVRLTATDSGGLTDEATITLHPETVNLTLDSQPRGVGLSWGGNAVTSPTTRAAAIGFLGTVSAPATYRSGNQTYRFASWSDGGDRLHTVTVRPTDLALTANYAPVAAFAFGPQGPSTGQTVSFDGSGSGEPNATIATYSWDFGDGSAAGHAAAPTHVYARAGTYTVTLAVTDSNGDPSTTTRELRVSDRPPTAAFVFAPTAPATGETVRFDAGGSSDPDGAVTAYRWDFGDGTTATGVRPSHAYATTGERTVTLTVTDDLGIAALGSAAVSVSAPVFGPRLSAVSLTHRRFRAGHTATALRAVRAPAGTELRYSVNERARISIAIAHLEPGVTVRNRCVAAGRGLRGRACTRALRMGTLSRSARAGADRVAFSGRVGARPLPPGNYRLTLVATSPAGTPSRPATVGFTIVTG